MTTQTDERIRTFLVEEARRVTAIAPSLDDAVATLAPRLERRATGGSRGLVVLFAAALLLAAALAATIAVGSGLLRLPQVNDPAPITGSLPAEQNAVIARHAAALNGRDAEAFTDVFAADGIFDPRGTFASSSSLFGNSLPIADQSLIEPFMAINDAWGFEVEVVTCDQLSYAEYSDRYTAFASEDVDLFAHCAVKSRWPRLSLEIGEWWTYEFSGTNIVWWSQTVRDATPADRDLPLGLDGLLDWESWLEDTDSDAAARLLNPRMFPVIVPCGESPEPPCEWSSDDDVERVASDRYGRAQDDWTIAGKRFMPRSLIPYDPALAAEIEASIEEFLRR